jgi:hypothetical protein
MEHECQKVDIINEMKKNIDNFNTIKDIVIELRTLVNMQIEQNKKQDDMLRQQHDTLIKITETVTQQGELLKSLNNKQNELDDKFVQKNIEELKQNSISLTDIIKDGISKYLPPIITAGLTYLILEITKK